MQPDRGFWRWYGVPVLVSMGLLGGLNTVYNRPELAAVLDHIFFLYTAIVLMAGGSLPALLLLWRGARAGRITRDDLGLGPSGWTAPRRLAGLAVIAAAAGNGFFFVLQGTGRHPGIPAQATPAWTDLCFWFAFLLSSSLAEMLVFVGVGFSLLERGLRKLNVRPALAALTAAAFASVTFGLYHYTHAPHFYPLVFPLMGEMFLMLVFFRLTRNFTLTFLLHNLTAAVGFAADQATLDPADLAAYVLPAAVLTNVAAFVVPLVLLHLLEWKGWPAASGGRQPPDAFCYQRPKEASGG